MKNTRQKQREVVQTLSAAAVMNLAFVRTKPMEVREREDGTWAIWYPDPGFTPCEHAGQPHLKALDKKCRQETMAGPKMIESSFIGATLAETLAEAIEMGSFGEPKVIPHETHAERMQRIWADKKQAKSTD